ncbi:Trifunctional UDP-glucose 4,6-dehydratase [Balamuthia mandrillaris]
MSSATTEEVAGGPSHSPSSPNGTRHHDEAQKEKDEQNGHNCSIYRPKNILITGGCGFIGSHVVELLVHKYPEYNVVNLDKLDYCASLRNLDLCKDKPNYKFIKGNILSADLVNYVLRNEKIDTIMHFAAQTHVDNSFGNSFQFTETNVLGTHVLLESAKVVGIKRFIHVSTDEVKGESGPSKDSYDEDRILEPTNPYAASKAAAELVVKSYHRSFQLPIIITRSNNVYGPHQFPEKIIPKFICLLHRKRKCYIHGTGKNKRNYIYATDVARAFDIILHKGAIGSTYNMAVQKAYSNLDVAKTLIELFGLSEQEQEYLSFVEDRPFNDKRYYIDSTSLKNLGWEPQVQWREGLKKTIEWYTKEGNRDRWQMDVESALVAHPRVGAELHVAPTQLG